MRDSIHIQFFLVASCTCLSCCYAKLKNCSGREHNVIGEEMGRPVCA
jgi:hypothetical protein